jgi:hypothetical protein
MYRLCTSFLVFKTIFFYFQLYQSKIYVFVILFHVCISSVRAQYGETLLRLLEKLYLDDLADCSHFGW